MRSRALFLDHVGALGGAELALIDVATAYRDTSTFLLFSDGPFRERLGAQGVKVEVIESDPALQAVRRESRWPGIRAVVEVVRLAWRVARMARDHDFLYANSQKAFVVASIAGVVARRPVIWDLNDLLTTEHFSRFNIMLDVLLANHVAVRVLANSKASADALIAQGGERHRVAVVYNGIDPTPFDEVTPSHVKTAHDGLGLNGGPLVGVFGRLTEWKGQHVALEAVARLPDVHLLLVGDALFGEQPYRDRLERMVDELGIRDRVHFLGFRTDIPALMRLVDVVAHTSTAPEPWGRVIVEGMLAGRPVVATRAGGVEEIVDDGQTGVLVEPGSPADLRAAIESLLNDRDRAKRMGEAAREVARARFTVRANVDSMTEQIESVVRR